MQYVPHLKTTKSKHLHVKFNALCCYIPTRWLVVPALGLGYCRDGPTVSSAEQEWLVLHIGSGSSGPTPTQEEQLPLGHSWREAGPEVSPRLVRKNTTEHGVVKDSKLAF